MGYINYSLLEIFCRAHLKTSQIENSNFLIVEKICFQDYTTTHNAKKKKTLQVNESEPANKIYVGRRRFLLCGVKHELHVT